MTTWGIKGSAAFDVMVTSPIIVSEVGVTAGVAARGGSMRKMMLNALNWAGFVSPLLQNHMVLGE